MEKERKAQLNGEDIHLKLERLSKLWRTHHNDSSSPWYKLDGFYILSGKQSTDEDNFHEKLYQFQFWLTGFQFPETLFLFTRDDQFIVVTSPKKLAYLEQIKGHHEKLTLLPRNSEDKNAMNFETIQSILKSINPQPIIASLENTVQEGAFFEQFQNFFSNFELKIIQNLTSGLIAVKTPLDLEHTKAASLIACVILKHKLITHIEDILDSGKQKTHSAIANLVNEIKSDTSIWEKIKHKFQVDPDEVEVVHSNVQSGNSFDLRVAEPTHNPISQTGGSIIVSLGVKYKEIGAKIVRTLFLNVKEEDKGIYNFTLEVITHLINALKPGTKCSEVYESVRNFIKQNKPNLLDKLSKNVGHVIGVEFRDSDYVLKSKNDVGILEAGMTVNVSVGFNNLESSTGHKYAVWIADMVHINSNSTPPSILTDYVSKRCEHISYYFEEDDEQIEQPKKPSKSSSDNGHVPTHILNNVQSLIISDRLRRRGVLQSSAEEADEQMKLQRELRQKKVFELKERFADGENIGGNFKKKKSTKMTSIKCYEETDSFPRDLAPNRLYVDPRSESLMVPMNGYHIPFHASTIKNVVYNSEEGQKFYTFRINFQVPGSQTLASKGEDNPLPDLTSPKSLYFKELLFRSFDERHIQGVFRNVKEMLRRVKMKETEEDVERDLAHQDKLQLNRTGRRVLLKDLLVRPNVQGSKKIIGTLEAHPNGLRFTFNSRQNENIDINYTNIKYAFFQPCEKELIVLIHFHLKAPILIGKKRTFDVQFFTETGTQADDLDNRRGGSYQDPDETQAEIMEREMKKRLNFEFKRFVTQVEEISNIEFDIPVSGLMFKGVPAKSNVEIMPTANCLVHLIEWPPFVLPLDDIEIVTFERVQHGLKEFDMTFVFKDYTKPVRRIDLIPISHIENIKRWLNDLELVWYELKNNLQWTNILKEILGDLKSFLDQNGFEGFLGDFSDEDEESENTVDEDDSYEGSDESSEEEASASDSEDESLVEETEDEGDFKEVSSGEEGLSWDELDEIAYKDDRKHLYQSENISSNRKKQKI